MTIDEAIQHCKEQVQEQAKKGCYRCAEEHQQLAEWLKELKAYRNKSEIPTSCGDAISRQAVLNLMRGLTRWCIRSEDGKWKNVGLLYDDVMFGIDRLPSVTPQPKMGRWIQKEEEDEAEPFIIWECSECHCVDEDGKPSYKYCPQCGAKMEVKE